MLSFISSPNARNSVGLRLTFARLAIVYWTGVYPRVCAHVGRWERRAARIPDVELRRTALASLREKRSNIDGAAAFAALAPRAWRGRMTLALSAFQATYNLLDLLGEQPSPDPVADGRRLHEALLYALHGGNDDDRAGKGPLAGRQLAEESRTEGSLAEGPLAGGPLDWYEHHPLDDDGGYLNELLGECRQALGGLPSFAVAAPAAREAAGRIVAFQSLNLSRQQGDHAALEQWARAATPAGSGLRWWETAAAAGSSLAVYALLVAATERDLQERDAQALGRAYFPWVGGVHSLLDNLIDKREDEAAGHRSLLEYYDPERAAQRLRWLTERAVSAVAGLPKGERHTVVLVAMIASYLSHPQAQAPELAPARRAVLEAAGPLVNATLLVFRLRALLGGARAAAPSPEPLMTAADEAGAATARRPAPQDASVAQKPAGVQKPAGAQKLAGAQKPTGAPKPAGAQRPAGAQKPAGAAQTAGLDSFR